MKNTAILRTALAIFSVTAGLFLAMPLAAAEDAARTPPDLRGVWKGATEVLYPDTTKKLMTELSVSEQNGWYFKGTRSWKLLDAGDKPLGYVMKNAVNEASEPFLGVIGFDGKKLTLVEDGDWGVMKAALVDDNTMQLIYSEAGEHPLVFRIVLTREKAGE